jgi:predicted  nucleic acid-binding Zn-ribbon protein
MEDNFSLLEEKVLRAVRLIQDLRAENARLQQETEECRQRYESLQAEHGRVSEELTEQRAAAAKIERFEEKRREIEEKVGGLLEKLAQIG